MANTITEENRKAAHKLDIAFIIIGAAIILGFGALFGRGVAEHLKYLTAGDKLRVRAEFVKADVRSGTKETDIDGNVSHNQMYDITYEYQVGDQTYTYVRKDETAYNERDIELRLYRSGSEEYRQTDMYGMWAGAHWFMLFLSVFIGFSLIRSGVKSIKAREAGTDTEADPKTDAENPAD